MHKIPTIFYTFAQYFNIRLKS